MNYIVIYTIRDNYFTIVVDDEGLHTLKVRQDNGELVITKVEEVDWSCIFDPAFDEDSAFN